MGKAAKILLWVSLGLELVYTVIYLLSSILPIFWDNSVSVTAMMGILVVRIIAISVPLLIKLMLILIMFFSLKGNSEKIVTEVITMILFCGIGYLFSGIVNTVATQLTAVSMGSEALVSLSQVSMLISYVGIIQHISNTALLLAASFSLAYKKTELVDIRRLQEEAEEPFSMDISE